MIQGKYFISSLINRGYNFFTGVPCSFLKPLINCVLQSERLKYIAVTSEGEGMGIASGAYLTGSKPVIMCQNSGLGNMINPLTSLNYPFRIPILLIVTLRGEIGINDEPQHELMGQITENMLDLVRIPWQFFPNNAEEVDKVLNQAEKEMALTKLPFALVMRKNSVIKMENIKVPVISKKYKIASKGQFFYNYNDRLSRIEVIQIISKLISDKDAVVATTGKISRELFTVGDSNNKFYVIGSMGSAAGIGFGIQHVNPKQRVFILDGDGSILMKMGSLATIGFYKPKQLVHIILDNETYESTGGQYSVSSVVDFCEVASACGYQQCYRVDTEETILKAIKAVKSKKGPSLIHIKVSIKLASGLGRPTLSPYEVKERFMKFLKRGG